MALFLLFMLLLLSWKRCLRLLVFHHIFFVFRCVDLIGRGKVICSSRNQISPAVLTIIVQRKTIPCHAQQHRCHLTLWAYVYRALFPFLFVRWPNAKRSVPPGKNRAIYIFLRLHWYEHDDHPNPKLAADGCCGNVFTC